MVKCIAGHEANLGVDLGMYALPDGCTCDCHSISERRDEWMDPVYLIFRMLKGCYLDFETQIGWRRVISS